jgi:phosphoesterase RecJ-like protein
MKIQDIQAIQLLLATPKKIAIIPHRGPDGDAMVQPDYIIFIKKQS